MIGRLRGLSERITFRDGGRSLLALQLVVGTWWAEPPMYRLALISRTVNWIAVSTSG